MSIDKEKLAKLSKIEDVRKYFEIKEEFDKFEDKTTLSSKMFYWGWRDTEISFLRETIGGTRKYYFHIEIYSKKAIPNIHSVKILLNNGVLNFDSPVAVTYSNSAEISSRKVSGELTLDQIRQITESTLCEMRIDEKHGNKEYPHKVAKEFQSRLKEFIDGINYLDGFPATRESILNELSEKKEAEIQRELLKKAERSSGDGKKSKIGSLIKWFFIIIFGLGIINTIFGDKSDSKSSKSTVKSPEQSAPVQSAPTQQEIVKDEAISKDAATQSDGK